MSSLQMVDYSTICMITQLFCNFNRLDHVNYESVVNVFICNTIIVGCLML